MTDGHTLGADSGTWRETDGGWELLFERRLRHSPERVWAALTTPEGLRGWLAAAEIEPRAGGSMVLTFEQPETEDFPCRDDVRRQANEILTWRPPELFEHSFGHPDSVVSWRLRPDGDGTYLTLTHRVPSEWEADLSRTLSGWHHHMEGLDDAARGVRHGWDWPRWRGLRDAYAAEVRR